MMGEGNRLEGYKNERNMNEGYKNKGYKNERYKNEEDKKVGNKKEANKKVGNKKEGSKKEGSQKEGSQKDRYKIDAKKETQTGDVKLKKNGNFVRSGKAEASVPSIGNGKPKRLNDTGEKGRYRESGRLEELRHGGKHEKSGADERNLNNERLDRRNTSSRGNSSKENSIRKKTVARGACPYLRECGGCNILKQSYEEELKGKQRLVQDLIKKYCSVEPIIGMKEPNYYRNKVHVVFDHDRKGNPISGVYQEGTHHVIPVEKCLIHNEKADNIIASIRGMLKSFKIKTYDEDSGYGLLRHVLIRTGFASGEIMVVLVIASPILPSKNNFVKALLKEHPEITTIVINVNGRATNMVLGNKEQVIYGKGYIEDYLCGKVFRISPKSFYQVNPAQTEVLYSKAIEMAELTGTETVIDAYCGIGTIGIIASDQAKKIIGVELNKDAVHDAHINTRRNDIKNMDIYNNDAGIFMSQMAEQKETAEVVFMDPPRAGSTEQFMDAIAQLKPKKVIYISCNPVTLERDLQYMTKKGYKAKRAVPVDMFPWTSHVETVVLMSRKDK